ncbi:MAG TPA: hypothetical protein VKP65_14050 [Rhodothermales bacterium]|nr:hypothetical protein [Rhodothermales bacterium]
MFSFKALLPFALLLCFLFAVVEIGTETAAAQSFKPFKAHNNITIQYAVLLPEPYDPDKAYPTAVAFAGAQMWEEEARQMSHMLWREPAYRAEWIIVIPLTPGEDWRTHPNHHALNDLLDEIRATYKVAGDTFHILGWGQDGADIASTWSSASPAYFTSLIAVNGAPFSRWDDKDLKNFFSQKGADLHILLIHSGAADAFAAFKQRMATTGKELTMLHGMDEATLRQGGVLKSAAQKLASR